MKVAYDKLLRDAGVDVLFHALVVDVSMQDGSVNGITLALLDGQATVHADVFIDCTGDAGIVFQAGAAWKMDHELQSLTYHFRLGNVQPGPNWKQLEHACQKA